MAPVNHLILASLALVSPSFAQHVHWEPPWVSSVVQSVTSELGPYMTYHGIPPHATLPPIPTGPFPYPQPPKPTATASACDYWLADIQHQGIAPFQSNATYQVFRNVQDFGAKGDGVNDDTAAINAAIAAGGDRCAPGTCNSTTTTPALVYFPPGTYLLSSSIIDYYYTQLIGNPNCLPTLLATSNFTGLGLIDGDLYGANGLDYGSTNVFWRQIRNFIIDTTRIPFNNTATGIHWPTAQATSLQNIIFYMSDAPGTMHQGVLVESGSGGFMTDLIFYGGRYGVDFGNQQFTMRNMTFYNAVTAINQLWDWGWTYKSISINNCSIGLNMSSGGAAAQSVGSITFIDSEINDTPVGILTAHNATSLPPTAGSLVLENVQTNNVANIIVGPQGPVLAGSTGSVNVAAWAEGHAYTPNGPQVIMNAITPDPRPASLLSGSKYYEQSKPQYETYPVSSFLSARSVGATGNGRTDDTVALQRAVTIAAAEKKILFVDAGDYLVTGTIYVPAGSKIVGESYSVILGSGAAFSDMTNPQPIVQIGHAGEQGQVEWSDMIVSTQGATAGAILIQWNLGAASAQPQGWSDWNDWSPSTSSTPSGIWDVHTRIGGFAGSNLQLAQCPTTPDIATPPAAVNTNCIAAFLTMHITPSANNLYLENVWLWTADHDVEAVNLDQITIYAGRGLLIESTQGNLWLYGTAVEHHTLYQYQLSNTSTIVMGQIQTETPYYQPNPPATEPFPPVAAYNDPIFATLCAATVGFNFTNTTGFTNPCDAYGLRITDSNNILVYGAGLYSFFDNYNTSCSAAGNGEACQAFIFSVEGDDSTVDVYNLNTVGSQSMITVNGAEVASYADNVNVFPDTVAVFRLDGPL